MTAPLSNDDFFVKLSELFEETRKKDHGSIFLTQKRFTYDAPKDIFPPASESTPFADTAPLRPLSLLIHATKERGNKKDKDYSKTKLSTVVTADALEVFFTRYAEVCKSGMSGLKKRDRSKAKAKQRAKKKAVPAGEEKKQRA